MRSRYDVIVLGGGPAGSAAARRLASRSLSVLIIEAKNRVDFKIGETLPGIATQLVYRAGFSNVFRNVPHVKCSGNQSSWGSSEFQFRSGLLNPYGGGSHVDRAKFDEQLLSEAVAAGAQLLRGVRPQSWARCKSGWKINLPPEARPVYGDAIVDCTGRQASFARSQGAKRLTIDKQIAIVGLLSDLHRSDTDLTTTIEAAHYGWWYTALLPNRRRVVVCFSDGDLLSWLGARSRKGFTKLIRTTTRIGDFLNYGYSVASQPMVVLADTSCLTNSVGDGWCAAGDAAASFDPIGSMGIINAIATGCHAARLILSGFVLAKEYTQMMFNSTLSNVKVRHAYYLMESRWPDAPFWRRRRTLSTHVKTLRVAQF